MLIYSTTRNRIPLYLKNVYSSVSVLASLPSRLQNGNKNKYIFALSVLHIILNSFFFHFLFSFFILFYFL